jgi:hypothetical protein
MRTQAMNLWNYIWQSRIVLLATVVSCSIGSAGEVAAAPMTQGSGGPQLGTLSGGTAPPFAASASPAFTGNPPGQQVVSPVVGAIPGSQEGTTSGTGVFVSSPTEATSSRAAGRPTPTGTPTPPRSVQVSPIETPGISAYLMPTATGTPSSSLRAPTNFRVQSGGPHPGSYAVSWEPPTNETVVGYRVVAIGAGGETTLLFRLPGSTNQALLTGLDPAVGYSLAIVAVDTRGQESALSNTTTTAGVPTATPTPLPSPVLPYGGGPGFSGSAGVSLGSPPAYGLGGSGGPVSGPTYGTAGASSAVQMGLPLPLATATPSNLGTNPYMVTGFTSSPSIVVNTPLPTAATTPTSIATPTPTATPTSTATVAATSTSGLPTIQPGNPTSMPGNGAVTVTATAMPTRTPTPIVVAR